MGGPVDSEGQQSDGAFTGCSGTLALMGFSDIRDSWVVGVATPWEEESGRTGNGKRSG